MQSGWFGSFDEFLATEPDLVLAALHQAVLADGFSRQWSSQTSAWLEEVEILRGLVAE